MIIIGKLNNFLLGTVVFFSLAILLELDFPELKMLMRTSVFIKLIYYDNIERFVHVQNK